jgi:CheY-like chemotaxis protein
MKESAVVLLVEENIDELYAFEKGMRQGGIRNPVRIVRHAAEARCYLEGVGVYDNRLLYPLPAVVLLDLALNPEGSSYELLTSIRRQPHLCDTPVVALGNPGTLPADVQRAFDLGANAYFAKETDLSELVRMLKDLQLLEDIWQRA